MPKDGRGSSEKEHIQSRDHRSNAGETSQVVRPTYPGPKERTQGSSEKIGSLDLDLLDWNGRKKRVPAILPPISSSIAVQDLAHAG